MLTHDERLALQDNRHNPMYRRLLIEAKVLLEVSSIYVINCLLPARLQLRIFFVFEFEGWTKIKLA